MIFVQEHLDRVISEHLAVLVVDRAGIIGYANHMAERMFKCKVVNGLAGTEVHELLPRSKRELHKNVLWVKYWDNPHPRLMEDGAVLHGERLNGEVFPIEVTLIPWKVPGVATADPAVIVIITDLSQRMQTLAKIQEQVEHASESK